VPIEIRYARPEEFDAVTELDAASFGLSYRADQLADIPARSTSRERWRPSTETAS
jgi:hypothetical protein